MLNLEEVILLIFEKHPDTSPLTVISFMEQNFELKEGVTAAQISVLRDEGKLTVSGQDENGVLLRLENA